jgi:hypothetical protein
MVNRSSLAVVLALVLSPSFVRAETNEEKAQALYDQAKTLVGEGNWDAACPKLLESKKLVADMKTVYRLAECYEHVGKLASAWRNYQEAAIAAAKAGETAKGRAALDRAAAIEPKLGRLRLSSKAPAGATLKVDGEVVPPPWVDASMMIDPGEHTIDVEAPGKKPFHGTVKTTEGTTPFAIPALESEASAPPPPATAEPAPIAPPPPETPKEPSSPTSMRTKVGWALIGTGVVATGIGGYLALSAKSKYHDADAHCPPSGCDEIGFAQTNDARSQANVATIVMGAGLAIGAAGIVVLVLPHKEETPSTTVSVTTQGVLLRGSF